MSGKKCKECNETGALHCSDPEHCGWPWDISNNLPREHSGPSDGEIYAAYSRRFEDPALRTAMIGYIRDVEDILRDDEA